MVLCGIASLQEVGKNSVGVDQWQSHLFSALHHPDAPVNVCRMAILQVVGFLLGNICAHIEGLVAYQHALAKRAPRQFLGRAQTAQVEELPLSIYNSRIAVNDGTILNP